MHDYKSKNLISIGILVIVIFLIIWCLNPVLVSVHYNYLEDYTQRSAIIVAIIAIIAFSTVAVHKIKSVNVTREFSRMLQELRGHFFGAIKFLSGTIVEHNGRKRKLTELPWYLLIGPPQSGKTSLLAGTKINYILAKQYKSTQEIQASHVCNWWVTKDLVLVDVPSYYAFSPLKRHPVATNEDKRSTQYNLYLDLWYDFLGLMKKHKQEHKLRGVIVSMNLAEMLHTSRQQQNLWMQELRGRLTEYYHKFGKPSVYLVITKMDLIPGFIDFFDYMGNEEINQLWGVNLQDKDAPVKSQYTVEHFANKFNNLIKQLNKQLLWRLHLEQNDNIKHMIKDLPLQLEIIKEKLIAMIKILLSAHPQIQLEGVYLTSVMQPELIMNTQRLDADQHGAMALSTPVHSNTPARSFFVKKILNYVLPLHAAEYKQSYGVVKAKYKIVAHTVYLLAVPLLLLLTEQILEQSLYSITVLKHKIQAYRDYTQKYYNIPAAVSLYQIIPLLNDLRTINQDHAVQLVGNQVSNYFTDKLDNGSEELYKASLNNILLPQIFNVFEQYLGNKANYYQADLLYDALKAYLVLDGSVFITTEDLDFVLQQLMVLNNNNVAASETMIAQLRPHLENALNNNRKLHLNQSLISQVRHNLLGLPELELAYIVLTHSIGAKPVSVALNQDQPILMINKNYSLVLPEYFTKGGLEHLSHEELQRAIDSVILGNPVLGKNIADLSASIYIAKLNTLSPKLEVYYLDQYCKYWENVIHELKITPVTNIAALDKLIVELLHNNKGLLSIAEVIYSNTNVEDVNKHSEILMKFNNFMSKQLTQNNDAFAGLLINFYKLHNLLEHNINNPLSADREEVIKLSKDIKNSANVYPEPFNKWIGSIVANLEQLLGVK